MILLGVLGACGVELAAENAREPPQTATTTAALTPCDPTPYITGFALTDLNQNPVTSIQPNTNYKIQVCGKVASVCLNLNAGGQLVGTLDPTTSCHDMTFPQPHVPGNIGTTFYTVAPSGPGIQMTGRITPWDACAGEQPDGAINFSLPGQNTCAPLTRRYHCGWALPGYGCDNGRRSRTVEVANMAAAFPACRSVQFPGYTDSCYVLALDGEAPTDRASCASAGGSWRPRNNCCNLRGTLSCPP